MHRLQYCRRCMQTASTPTSLERYKFTLTARRALLAFIEQVFAVKEIAILWAQLFIKLRISPRDSQEIFFLYFPFLQDLRVFSYSAGEKHFSINEKSLVGFRRRKTARRGFFFADPCAWRWARQIEASSNNEHKHNKWCFVLLKTTKNFYSS